jgi:glycine hydroxymethyltransferase
MVNMNRLPYDPLGQSITSGIRLGTPIVTYRGMKPTDMAVIADHVATVLNAVELTGPQDFNLNADIQERMRRDIRDLCRRFPTP